MPALASRLSQVKASRGSRPCRGGWLRYGGSPACTARGCRDSVCPGSVPGASHEFPAFITWMIALTFDNGLALVQASNGITNRGINDANLHQRETIVECQRNHPRDKCREFMARTWN